MQTPDASPTSSASRTSNGRPRPSLKGERLFTTTDVGALCQVDVKTIHNWVEKGSLKGFRTPGRHLRFRADDVVSFLTKFGYPIPAELAPLVPAPVVGTGEPCPVCKKEHYLTRPCASPSAPASQASVTLTVEHANWLLDELVKVGVEDSRLDNLDDLIVAAQGGASS